jgi:hypothetical protein
MTDLLLQVAVQRGVSFWNEEHDSEVALRLCISRGMLSAWWALGGWVLTQCA